MLIFTSKVNNLVDIVNLIVKKGLNEIEIKLVNIQYPSMTNLTLVKTRKFWTIVII